jgi:hypothetical protein
MTDLPERPRADRDVTREESFDFGHHIIEACEFKVASFGHWDPLPSRADAGQGWGAPATAKQEA